MNQTYTSSDIVEAYPVEKPFTACFFPGSAPYQAYGPWISGWRLAQEVSDLTEVDFLIHADIIDQASGPASTGSEEVPASPRVYKKASFRGSDVRYLERYY
ncbi:MAG: hypothetical protein ACRYFX_24130 [Janthinobacterium lividum]